MDNRVFDFLGDPLFYDQPAPHPKSGEYLLPRGRDWSTWRQHRSDAWHEALIGPPLPAQGWKIHIAATPANAQQLLDATADYAWGLRLGFKFVPDRRALLRRNGKQSHRGTSGKFITLYPRDEDELERSVLDLDARLGGADGPYILSDLRWRSGPVHVRYGGFALMTVEDHGEQVPAIRRPDGHLVPDERTSGLVIPEWVEPPAFLHDELMRIADTAAPSDFRYRITDALHFSNGGGVYRARDLDHDDQPVVLKEARPFAGLSEDGRDALERLRHEAGFLRIHADDSAIVRAREVITLGDHLFLALDEIEGMPLNKAVTSRSPSIRARATVTDYVEYRDWALIIIDSLDAAVGRLHGRGTVHGDLHPNNVMVTGDDRIVLLDFEFAHHVTEPGLVGAGAPGFTAPAHLGGIARDHWSKAAIALSLFFPLTPLIGLDSTFAARLIEAARTAYALPDELAERLHRELAPSSATPTVETSGAAELASVWPTHSNAGLVTLRHVLGTSLDTSADYTRRDRCHPGDPEQFRDGGFGLAHGAAGIIHAQHAASLDVDPRTVSWLQDAVARTAHPRLGLYDGLAGVELVLRAVGAETSADEIHQIALERLDLSAVPPHLYGGLAGIGLSLLIRPTPHIVGATRIARELERRLDRPDAFPAGSQHAGRGLMWGPTGVALFATRLFELTSKDRYLALAIDALDRDISTLVAADDGSLQIDEGWRLMPYLATGSAGIALVIAQALPYVHRDGPYLRTLEGIQLALQTPFTIESTLFNGRAGIVHTLALLERLDLATPESITALDRHVDGLRLHALPHGDGLAFAGSGLLRASQDLATGTAGVLSALEAYRLLRHDPDHGGWTRQLPLLLPATAGTPHRKEVNHDDGIPPQPAAP